MGPAEDAPAGIVLEDDALDNLIDGILRGESTPTVADNNDNDNNDDDDDHHSIASAGADTWVTIKSASTAATASASTTSPRVSPLNKSAVSSPLLSSSVDHSLANDLAAAMAYAVPSAEEITEFLQDMYMLPDYRVHNDDEYSYSDESSASSSEGGTRGWRKSHSKKTRKESRSTFRPSDSLFSSKAKTKNTSSTKVLGRRRRSQFRRPTKADDKDSGGRSRSKSLPKSQRAQNPLVAKINGDKLIGLRIMLNKKSKVGKDKEEVTNKKKMRLNIGKKGAIERESKKNEGKSVRFGVQSSSSPSTSIDASDDADDILPSVDDFISTYGLTVEKTIEGIKSAVDAVATSDANDLAYAVLGRPAGRSAGSTGDLADKSPLPTNEGKTPSASKKKGRNRKKGVITKEMNVHKIELLRSNHASTAGGEDSQGNGRNFFVSLSQIKLRPSLFKSLQPNRGPKTSVPKSPDPLEQRGSRRKVYRFKIGRRPDNPKESDDTGIATSPRRFLRFGQRSSGAFLDSDQYSRHDSDFGVNASDVMINRRTRITVVRQEADSFATPVRKNKLEGIKDDRSEISDTNLAPPVLVPPPVSENMLDLSTETNASDDVMINHRTRITVTRPTSSIPQDDANDLDVSADTPIRINYKQSPAKALVRSSFSTTTNGDINEGARDDIDDAFPKVRSSINDKWIKSSVLFRSSLSSLSKMRRSKNQQLFVPSNSGSAGDADAAAKPAVQMDEQLLVQVAELADELYGDALTPSMSVLRATKILERYPGEEEKLVVSLKRRVEEKSASSTKKASNDKKTLRNMETLLDLTSLTDVTEEMSSPDPSPAPKSGNRVSATTAFGDVVEGIEKYGAAIENLLKAFANAENSGHVRELDDSTLNDASSGDIEPVAANASAPIDTPKAGERISLLGMAETSEAVENPSVLESNEPIQESQKSRKMGAVVGTFGLMAAGLITAAVTIPKKTVMRRKKGEDWQPFVDVDGEEGDTEYLIPRHPNTSSSDDEINSIDADEEHFDNVEVKAAFVHEFYESEDKQEVLGESIQFSEGEEVEISSQSPDTGVNEHDKVSNNAETTMDEEVGVEVNLTTELDESTKADEHVDVGMNISLSNEGVEIYLDVGNDDAVINEIRSNMQSDDFLRDLSVKLELYMRLEAIYGKAESEEHAQRRLQAVLNRFEGREGVVLLALRRQMESQAAEEGGQINNDEDVPTGSGDYERAQASIDDNAKESNETTRTKIFKGFVQSKSIRKTKNISTSIEERSELSSSHGASNIDVGHSSRDDDDLYDADISADLDEFFNVPVEI